MGEISRLLTTVLLNALWQITAIAALAILCARLLRRMPSRYGYAMWVLALAGCWLVPVTTVVIQASVAPGIRAVDAASKTDSAVTERVPQTKAGLSISFHALSRSLSVSPLLMRGLLWTYAALLLFHMARLAWALYRTAQFRKCSYPRPMSSSLGEIAETCMRAFSLPPIPVLCSPRCTGPATVGFRRPVLILPEAFFTGGLSDEDVFSAFLHEMAHIRRRDFFFNLLFEFGCVPVWFHPGVALIRARIAQARELACDELAAPMLPSEAHYARSLLHIAQSMFANIRSESTYALSLFDTNTLEERIMNILNASKASKKWARAIRLTTACFVGAVSLGISAFSLNVASGSTPAELQKFAGTWEAKYNGKTFFTLKLEVKDGALTGSCIHTERVTLVDGELIPDGEANTTDRVLEAHASGQKLTLKIGDGSSSSDAIPLEFSLTGKNEGEGRVIGESSTGTPPPKKPWHFQRVGDSQ
jgi:beta-lactamase regulating signal transducer with metallopeptidase domain